MPGRTRRVGFYGRYAGGQTTELKFHDVDVNQVAANLSGGVILPNTGPTSFSLNNIAQAVGESNRIGRKCTIKSISWKGQLLLVQIAGAGLGAGETIRMMLILDKQCNGTNATVTGVLETADWNSFNNLVNKGRFRTLYEQTFTMSHLAAAGDGAANDSAQFNQGFTFFKNCDIPIEFNNTTGALAEIRSNNLFVLMISRNVGLTVVLDSKVRLRFEG